MTESEIRDAFAGTWQLRDCYSERDGERFPFPLGERVLGRINYDRDGNMAAQLMRADREQFSSRDPREVADAEYRAAYHSYTSYFGTYTIDAGAGAVSHHVVGASVPGWPGQVQVRYFELGDGTLTLKTPPMRGNDGAKSVHTLVWEKVC